MPVMDGEDIEVIVRDSGGIDIRDAQDVMDAVGTVPDAEEAVLGIVREGGSPDDQMEKAGSYHAW